MNFNQTFSVLFWLNKAKANKQGLAPIWVRITVDGKRAECSVVEGFVLVSVIDIFITVGFWLNNSDELAHLFSFKGFSFRILGLTIFGAVIGGMVVSVVANLINLSIQDDVF